MPISGNASAFEADAFVVAVGDNAARLAGVTLGARVLTNMNMRELTGRSPEGAIHVRKGITINAPADLKGKKIGVPGLNSVIDVLVRMGGR